MAVQALLVDTDVFSFVARQRDQAEPFRPILEGRLLALSFATVGEVYYGAARAGWGQPRLRDLATSLRRYTILPGTVEIARCFGEVKSQFRDQFDEGDMWIAATAMAHELPIVTNNLRHFEPMNARFGFGLEHPSYRADG
ncbi:PIN domain-containing protein [Candidatus Poriferisodalis sp.]|uniref:PIN domain-containing protein n=1 Tax=Candidatus Poriferisodalis sp. TaxID=3101277 RepID=UPI003B01DA5E